MFIYSDRDRASEPYSLPNCEVFYMSCPEAERFGQPSGWYWWSCFPGCMPDGDPSGPFNTEEEAIADCQSDY